MKLNILNEMLRVHPLGVAACVRGSFAEHGKVFESLGLSGNLRTCRNTWHNLGRVRPSTHRLSHTPLPLPLSSSEYHTHIAYGWHEQLQSVHSYENLEGKLLQLRNDIRVC